MDEPLPHKRYFSFTVDLTKLPEPRHCCAKCRQPLIHGSRALRDRSNSRHVYHVACEPARRPKRVQPTAAEQEEQLRLEMREDVVLFEGVNWRRRLLTRDLEDPNSSGLDDRLGCSNALGGEH